MRGQRSNDLKQGTNEYAPPPHPALPRLPLPVVVVLKFFFVFSFIVDVSKMEIIECVPCRQRVSRAGSVVMRGSKVVTPLQLETRLWR